MAFRSRFVRRPSFRPLHLGAGILLGVLIGAPAFGAVTVRIAKPNVTEFPLWPGTAPGSEPENLPSKNYVEIWSGNERPAGRETVKQISTPTLAFFPADPAKSKGVAMIIAPGGGYNLLAINHEGWEVAQHFAKEGIACFVLKYRHFDRAIALRDAHRAIRIVRQRAAEWRIDPARIGMGGFSAGGHLALHAAANRTPAMPWAADDVDRVSNRVDFLMLIYPSSIAGLPPEAVIDAQFPPVFLVNATGDNVGQRALPLVEKLASLNLRFEAHLFAAGTHGQGFYHSIPSTGSWPQLFSRWIDEQLAPGGGIRPAPLQTAGAASRK